MGLRDRIKQWWKGERIPPKIGSGVGPFIAQGIKDEFRHSRSALAARAVVAKIRDNWGKIIGTVLLAILSVLLSRYLK